MGLIMETSMCHYQGTCMKDKMIFRLLKLYSFSTITSIVYIASAKRKTRPFIMIDTKPHFSFAVLLQVASKNYSRRYFTSDLISELYIDLHLWPHGLSYKTSIYLVHTTLQSTSIIQNFNLAFSGKTHAFIFHMTYQYTSFMCQIHSATFIRKKQSSTFISSSCAVLI